MQISTDTQTSVRTNTNADTYKYLYTSRCKYISRDRDIYTHAHTYTYNKEFPRPPCENRNTWNPRNEMRCPCRGYIEKPFVPLSKWKEGRLQYLGMHSTQPRSTQYADKPIQWVPLPFQHTSASFNLSVTFKSFSLICYFQVLLTTSYFLSCSHFIISYLLSSSHFNLLLCNFLPCIYISCYLFTYNLIPCKSPSM